MNSGEHSCKVSSTGSGSAEHTVGCGMWDAPQVNDLQLHAAFPKAARVVNAYQNSARLFKLPQFPNDL